MSALPPPGGLDRTERWEMVGAPILIANAAMGMNSWRGETRLDLKSYMSLTADFRQR